MSFLKNRVMTEQYSIPGRLIRWLACDNLPLTKH